MSTQTDFKVVTVPRPTTEAQRAVDEATVYTYQFSLVVDTADDEIVAMQALQRVINRPGLTVAQRRRLGAWFIAWINEGETNEVDW